MVKVITDKLKIAFDLKTFVTIVSVVATVSVGVSNMGNKFTSLETKIDSLVVSVAEHKNYVDELVEERNEDHNIIDVTLARLESNMAIAMNHLGL